MKRSSNVHQTSNALLHNLEKYYCQKAKYSLNISVFLTCGVEVYQPLSKWWTIKSNVPTLKAPATNNKLTVNWLCPLLLLVAVNRQNTASSFLETLETFPAFPCLGYQFLF